MAVTAHLDRTPHTTFLNTPSRLRTVLSINPAALAKHVASAAKWMNDNQGVVSLGIFLATLFLGWASGIFAALRRKPKFLIELIPGPTFVCIFTTGGKFDGHDIHRVGISLYLSIANSGSASSSVHALHVGYRWNLIPFTKNWTRYTLLRYWLRDRTAALTDFQVAIGDHIKVFPFLFQQNSLSPVRQETYLQPGQSVVGVVYFEQGDSWGGCQPLVRSGRVRLSVRLLDVFGRRHTRTFSVPAVALEEARRFNPSFGRTRAALSGKPLPGDDG